MGARGRRGPARAVRRRRRGGRRRGDDADGRRSRRRPSIDDVAAARWDAAIAAEADDEPAAIAFVGRPNVGKSSLLNALLGEERTIVSRHARARRATRSTRRLAWGRSEIVLIDTAGIRRRGKVASGPAAERYSTLRSLKAIVAGRRRGPRHRRRRGPDRPGRARRRLRRRGGQGPRRRGQQVGPRRGEDRQDVRPVRRVDPQRGRRSSTSRRSSRSAPRPASASSRVLELAVDIWGERRKRVPTGELNRLVADGRRPRSRRRSSRAAGRSSSTRRRSPSRRRRSCSSPATRARSTSATGATSRTGCATTFGFDGTPIRLVFRERASVKLPRRRRKAGGQPSEARGRGRRRPPGESASRAGLTVAAMTDGRPRVAVVGSGRLGHDARAHRRRARAGHAPVPLARRRRRGSATARRNERAPAGHRPAAGLARDRRPGGARATRPTSSIVRRPVGAPPRRPSARVAPHIPPSADVLSVVKGSSAARCCG